MRRSRRNTLAGIGAVTFGSGINFTTAAFNSATSPAADFRVRVAEGLEVRAGRAFNDDGSVDTSNSNINTDLYIDPRETGNTVGEDFYDGNELGPVFDDRDPPLATVSARGNSISNDYAGINEQLEMYIVPSLDKNTSFDDLLEIKNTGTNTVNRVGILYDRGKSQYGDDVTVTDDFDSGINYNDEIGPLGVQEIFQFYAEAAGSSFNGKISPDSGETDPPDAPAETDLDNSIGPGQRWDLRLDVEFNETWNPPSPINLKQVVRNVADTGNVFTDSAGLADLLDEITVGIEDPNDPFY